MPPMSQTESKRLFIGLELPSACKATLVTLDPRLRGLRWLPADQLHLTLSFLGEVAVSRIDTLHEALDAVRVPPFFLPLSGLGAFSNRGQPSVVWVGVGQGHPHLFALHRHVQDAVLHAGLEPDLKSFHPHVTVGRAKGISRAALQPLLRRHAATEFDLFKVTEFVLFSSVVSAEGATHSVEFRKGF
jgi:2'-5' RNA ligase